MRLELPSPRRVTVTVTVTVRTRAMAALLLLAALAGAVQRAAAVPFAELEPKPALQLFPRSQYNSVCVLMASGRGVSSITAADLAQFAGQQCARPVSAGGSVAFSVIDLR